MMMWLNRVPYWEQFQHALAKRSPGTGNWLLKNQEFQTWYDATQMDKTSSMIWLTGAPGSGKTVLSATLIEYLHHTRDRILENKPFVAYFYCTSENRHKTSLVDICASILSQILAQLEYVPSAVLSAYQSAKAYGHSVISTSDRVFPMLQDIVQSLPILYLIIDALDECEDVLEIANVFSNAAQSLSSLRLMVLSRDTPCIRKQFQTVPSIRLNAMSMRKDIDCYLLKAVETLAWADRDLKDRVFAELSDKANGMFLFANLSIKTLQAAVNLKDVADTLDRIPTELGNFYKLILESISRESPARQKLAQKILLWICGSTRPLTWPELQCALSWVPEKSMICPDLSPFMNAVLELCFPLIEYQSGSGTFHFAHYSVREYLVESESRVSVRLQRNKFEMAESEIHGEIAKTMLSYLTWDRVCENIILNPAQYPLAQYATENWCHHLSLSGPDEKLHIQYVDFVAPPNRRINWIARSLISEELPFPLQNIIRLQKLVHSWYTHVSGSSDSVENLSDIQMALFQLDDIQSVAQPVDSFSVRKISNFERSIIVRDLAREYTMAGQLDKGIQMFETAFSKSSCSGSPTSIRTCWLLNSLGILYDQKGEVELAEKMQRKALSFQEKELPHDHLDIVLTINELGRICRHLGRLKEAETLHRKALSTLITLFSDTDLHITWTKNALGRCLLRQGRPQEAAALHEEVLAVEIQLLGKDHPHPLWIMSDLARCYRDQGRIKDAISMQSEMLERQKKSLGLCHPDTLWAANSLGLLYEISGDVESAKNLHVEALEGQVKQLGDDHPHTRWSKKILEKLG